MKKFSIHLALVACGLALAASNLVAAQAKTYQVTGSVLELTDDAITVQKGDEKWQVARSKDAKVTGDLKVGAKVTIEYRMVATDIEVKPGKSDKADKPEKAEKANDEKAKSEKK